MAETEVQLQSRLQAARNVAALAERQRVAGLGVKAPAAISQAAPSSAQQTPAMMADNVQLSDGSWVNKETFYKLSEDDQARLRQLGIQGFNNFYAQKETDFKANNIQLKDGSWVTKTLYDSLSADDKTLLSSIGIEEFNKKKTAEFETFKSQNIQLNDGSWIAKTDYDKLPVAWQSEVQARGADSFQSWLKTAYGGSKDLIIITNFSNMGRDEIFAKTADPNIGIDAGGNRIWIGGKWPDSTQKTISPPTAIAGEWPKSVSTFNPISLPEMKGVEAVYIGTSSVLGGTWGITPEALAVQKLGGNVIEYKGASELVGQKLTAKAIAELSPTDKVKYEAETKAIQSMPRETITEKLKAREEYRVLVPQIAQQSAQYEKLGAKLTIAQTADGSNISAVQMKNGDLLPKNTFDNLSTEKQKLAVNDGLKAIYITIKKTGELVDKDSLAELTKSDSILAGILSEHGYDAYMYAFKTKYITLGATGENMPRVDFNKSTPEVQQFLQEKGIVALNSLQGEVQSRLVSYKSKDGYDVASFLRDNGNKPELASELVLAGFKKVDIDNAVEFNKQPFAEENKVEAVWNKIQRETKGEFPIFSHLLYPAVSYEARQEHDIFIKQYPQLAAELFQTVNGMRAEAVRKSVQPSLSLDAFTAEYAAARGIGDVHAFLHKDLDKANMRDLAAFKYEQLYGTRQSQLAVGAGIIATLWTPGKMTYPEISPKDITAMEWGVGVAQIALLAAPGAGGAAGRVISPLAGKLTSIGIQSAAGVVFTAETVKSANDVMTKWDTMTIAEQDEAKKNIAISALMDAWVISGVLSGLKGIRSLPAKAQAKVEIPKTAKMPSVAIKQIANTQELGILRSKAMPVAEGYTRVYRGEPSPGRSYMTGGKTAAELAGAEKKVSGRWYSADIGEAKAYTAGKGESVLYFVDIPTKELPKFKPTGEAATWAPAEAEHYVLSGRYLKKALVHPDSISLKSLQAKLDKLVTVSPEEAAILRANVPQAVAFESVKGKVAVGVGRLEAEKLLKLAKESGAAYDDMKVSLTKLEKIPLKSNSYARLANDVQKAIQKSRVTDKALFNKLQILQDITPKELGQLEKLSKLIGRTKMEELEFQRLSKLDKISVQKISESSMSAKTLSRVKQLQGITNKTPAEIIELKGLTEKVSEKLTTSQLQRLKELGGKLSIGQGIKDINQSISGVNKAWNVVDKTKVNTPQRLQALKNLDDAKTKLNATLENWNDNISKPRYRTTAAPSSVEVINTIEKRLEMAKRQRSIAEREYSNPVTSSGEKEIIRDDLRSLNSDIGDLESKMAEYTKLMNKGQPLPADATTYYKMGFGKAEPYWGKTPKSKLEPKEPISPASPIVKTVKEKAIDLKTGKEIEITRETIEQRPRPVAVAERPVVAEQLTFDLELEPNYKIKEKPSVPEGATKVPKVISDSESTYKVTNHIAIQPKVTLETRSVFPGMKEPKFGTSGKLIFTTSPWLPEKPIEMPEIPGVFMPKIVTTVSRPLTGLEKELQAGLQAVTEAAIKAYNETLVDAMTSSRVSTAGLTKTQLNLATITATNAELQAKIEAATRAAIQTQLKTLANPKVKTLIETKYQQKIITKLATPIKPRLPVPIIIIPGAGGKGTIELTEKQKQGIVAWKQGFIFWLKWPDKNGHYPEKNTYYSRSPIEGVEYVKGIGSVAKSIIAKYGRIPEDIKFSMGIQDVDISKTPAGKKPEIEFELAHKYKKHHIKHKAQIEPMPSLRGAR
ncbi:hypothetical protein MUP46_01045 [Patescibacteria group bacterium]|nr:hypothetical protein [Patescibacteria group bacterium]